LSLSDLPLRLTAGYVVDTSDSYSRGSSFECQPQHEQKERTRNSERDDCQKLVQVWFITVSNKITRWRSWLRHCPTSRKGGATGVSTGGVKAAGAYCWQSYHLHVPTV